MPITILPQPKATITITAPDQSAIVMSSPPSSRIVIAAQGVQGPPGAGGDASFTAASALSGHVAVRAVAGGVARADAVNGFDVIGITTHAAELGAPVTVRFTGEIAEPSWAWSIGPVWLGTNGALTQVAPSTGAIVQVAQAIAPSRVVVSVSPPILIA